MPRSLLAFLLLGLLSVPLLPAVRPAEAQEPSPTAQFPARPESWINFGPLTVEQLRGKAAVLYFFEEGCPRCRERWPELLTISHKYQGQPVLFIAVNSGNSRAAVQNYVRQQKIHWPVIVDTNRQLERMFRVPEISLNNIMQVAVLRPDGTVASGSWSQFEATVQQALRGAAWKVDPAAVPAELRSAWLQIELGNYAAAAPAIKKARTSAKAETQQAAEKLQAAVQTEIEQKAAEAEQQLQQGQKWNAYKLYEQLSEQYDGYTLPDNVTQQKQALADDPAIAKELRAFKSLAAAKKLGARGSAASVRRAATMLRQLAQEYPGTEAASEAESILLQIDAQP